MFNHGGCGKQIATPDDAAQTKAKRLNGDTWMGRQGSIQAARLHLSFWQTKGRGICRICDICTFAHLP